MGQIKWEEIEDDTEIMKVIGGWLVKYSVDCEHYTMCFVPDAEHLWLK